MPKVLFNLRNSDASRFDTLNDQLRTSRPDYLVQFGQVGSPEWWRNYDAGLICKDEAVGVVIHLGTHKKWGEDPAVVIRTDRRDNAYDLTGFWLDPSVQIGAWIHVQQFKIVIQSPTGAFTSIMDAFIEVLDDVPLATAPWLNQNH